MLITGSTGGIGRVAAKALAQQGHTVIVHGRSKAKAEQACAELRSETGNDRVDYLFADFLSLTDIQRMAAAFNQKYDRLDVLLNNAGGFMSKTREVTKEGLEKTMTLNFFAPFLLMQLFMDALKRSPSARVINTSSAMHRRAGRPDLSDLQSEKKYSPAQAYGVSKLYLIWVTRHLAALLKEQGVTNVTVNASHPGAVATNFGQDADKGFLINLVFKAALLFMDKPEKGAMTSLFLATSPKVEHVTGKFFSNRMKEEQPDDTYYSKEDAKVVWDQCMAIVKPYL